MFKHMASLCNSLDVMQDLKGTSRIVHTKYSKKAEKPFNGYCNKLKVVG